MAATAAEAGLADPGDLFQPRWFWDSLTWPQPPCTAERSLSAGSLRYSKPNPTQSWATCSSDAASSSAPGMPQCFYGSVILQHPGTLLP